MKAIIQIKNITSTHTSLLTKTLRESNAFNLISAL